jgi:hypothetical protein
MGAVLGWGSVVQQLYQFKRLDAFIQNETHSQFAEFDLESGVGESSEDDNGSVREFSPQAANGIQPHSVAHHWINEDNSGVRCKRARNDAGAAVRESDYNEVCFAFQTDKYLRSNLQVIVGENNGNAFHHRRV